MEDDFSDLFINNLPSEMSSTGSICCLSKRTITNIFGCTLACITYISIIYFSLAIYCLVASTHLDIVFLVVALLSLFSVITTPIGIFGCSRTSYCALFTFVIFASFHLYGLIMYFWFNLKAPIFESTTKVANSTRIKNYEDLHYLTSGSYTGLVGLSILLASCKILSLIEQIEPARVIVVDNTAE